MKSIKRHLFKIATATMLTFSLVSCDKFLNVEPVDSLSGNNFWKDVNDAETFTLEIYRLFRESALLKGPYFIMGELRNAPVRKTGSYPNRWDIQYAAEGNVPKLAYEVRPTPGTDANRFWTYNVEWDILDDWTPFYRVIQGSNILFENIGRLAKNDPSISSNIIQSYQAEAVYMRCLSYFFLLRLYGDVPYYTNANNSTPLPRLDHVQVAKNCIAELEKIKDNLPWTYEEPANRGVRAMRGSVLALMMNLYMWMAGFDEPNATGYYQKVDALGDELVQQGMNAAHAYELIPLNRMDEIFQGRSRETLFEIPNSVNYQGFVSANSRKMIPFYVLDGFMVNLNQDKINSELAYSPEYLKEIYPEGVADGRKGVWFDDSNWLSGDGKFRFYKFLNFEFKGANSAENYGNSITIFRMAESILLQAEANGKLGNEEKAASLLNLVRARAEATLYPGNGYDNINEAIYYERCKELMGEGWYFFDIVRTKKIIDIKYVSRPMSYSLFQAGAWTWPIDRKALTNNPYMKLNYWNQ